MKYSDWISVGSSGSLTLTLTWVVLSYDGPARTRRRKFLRLRGEGEGVLDLGGVLAGVLAGDKDRGVKDVVPIKLRGIVGSQGNEEHFSGVLVRIYKRSVIEFEVNSVSWAVSGGNYT